MRKVFGIVIASMMALALAACGSSADTGKSEGVMTYEEYMAADAGSEVAIEAYVQEKLALSDSATSFYCQDAEGGYYVSQMGCSDEIYAQLSIGRKIRVTGTKNEENGEILITDAEVEILSGSKYEADPVEVTDCLGSDDLIHYQNRYVSMSGLTVTASYDADGNETAYIFGEDGSGSEGDDIYFHAAYGDVELTFVVNTQIRDSSTSLYGYVQKIKIGAVINVDCYLYWNDGAVPQMESLNIESFAD